MTKIITFRKLAIFLKTSKKTKVLATGCFDLLHQAHADFLKAAKKQKPNTILIVGIEADKRVKQLKGEGRPANQEQTRLKNLAKLNIADFVFLLPEKFKTKKDHLNLLRLLKPDILAVSENTPNIEEKRKLMKKMNGQLKIVFPHKKNLSTTKILESF